MILDTKIVGILNLTPDSFSGDGKLYTEEELIEKINFLIESGAYIIDVGAESTAPGSSEISLEEEFRRLEIFFKVIKNFPNTYFSLDTLKSQIAEYGIKAGVKMINDVSGGRYDENMINLISKNSHIKYVLMYAKNSSGRADLEKNTDKRDILEKLFDFFEERISFLEKSGVSKSQIILDTGMGAFISNDYMDSVRVLKNLNLIKEKFNLPLYIGTSRKGFLKNLSNDNGPQDRLGSSIASSLFGVNNGADFIRVHDVKETKQFIESWNKLNTL